MLLLSFSCTPKDQEGNLAVRTKVVLRAVGNDLLLSQNDTTSLVLPVKQISENKYLLSFENSFLFDPAALYAAMDLHSTKAALPSHYNVEVLRCSDGEVGYSYLLTGDADRDIISCEGRILPENCYTIQFTYLEEVAAMTTKRSLLFYVLVFLVLAFLVIVFYSKYHAHRVEIKEQNATIIGSYYFYPDQNKLVRAATEIALSKKECELLVILATNVNQIVKRETLEKEVWEDQGVVVGRSLDTYISKLRKKLNNDNSLKITNIHGVGYKLEINE